MSARSRDLKRRILHDSPEGLRSWGYPCISDSQYRTTPACQATVETTSGPVADGAATPKIHAALQQRGLLPGIHIVDTGFLDAELFIESQTQYGIDLLRPTRLDYHWQARAGVGFDARHFTID